MAERDDLGARVEPGEAERSSEKIRQDIAAKRETISDTVDRLGERIQEKLDWRGYVARYPYWAIGTAAGVGFLASSLFRRRPSPADRIVDAFADTIEGVSSKLRDAVGGIAHAGTRGVMKGAVTGMIAKAAADWLKEAASQAIRSNGSESRRAEQYSSTYNPAPDSSRVYS
jgi:ElaB/YqjD/DUF883 family membrane-anchored ribosome-binding protein